MPTAYFRSVAPAGTVSIRCMEPLRVALVDIAKFADGHTTVAAAVRADSSAAESSAGELAGAYGPTGAMFSAAVTDFLDALLASGRQLADDYDQTADALRAGAQNIDATDHSSAGRFHGQENLAPPAPASPPGPPPGSPSIM